ncbi:uncharacterized protein LOC142628394 [Castanea sativa]|uniref:uncharacterized protein LOC142628394 n=1 Tax=Castanea sativa TaxID=21020 RepID=UPI003F64FA75
MFMCRSCDRSLHDGTSQHQKQVISSYMGCPSAKDFAALWGFELNEVGNSTQPDHFPSTSHISEDSSVVNLAIPRQSCSQIGGPSVLCAVNPATLGSSTESEVGSSSQQSKDYAIIVLNNPPKLPVKGNLPVHSRMDALAAATLCYDYDEGPKLVSF